MSTRTQHLRKLLLDFVPATDREATFRLRMLEHVEQATDPFDRDHYTPGHFTASGFVLSPDGSGLLLIHHRKLHRWLQPGGHIEPTDATVIAAALREVREETGIEEPELVTPLFDLDIHEIPPHGGTPAHLHLDVRCLFRAHSEVVQDSAEVNDIRWVPVSRVKHTTDDESVLRAVRKLETPSRQSARGATADSE